MDSPFFDAQAADLDRLSEQGRRRSLAKRVGVDFASNDYLGLAASPELADAAKEAISRGVPVGSGGSRLLRGNHPEHEILATEAAAHFGSESALYFSSGFAANGALLAALPQRGDLVVYDELIHASAHDGMRLGRAEFVPARHNDPEAFERAITNWRNSGGTGRTWIAVETLYSMDGDRAPLTDLADIATRHEAILLLDEAHATGVFGPAGRGLAAHLEGAPNVITLRTCGKALGCEGALVCGPEVVTDFLINRARGFIFSTAPSPLMASCVRTALKLSADDGLRDALRVRIATAEQALGFSTGSQIMPVVLGEEARTMAVAAKLQRAGFDVRGIRPPTVPEGSSRLRLSLTLNASQNEIKALCESLAHILETQEPACLATS
ncbi:8-amino-7-oxononanoate synthase [Altererythrobacter sp. ZODW24]|uniref:8-amino-7-oxononanoate synthase n=1 Tax=Altererythrobacter sp. ZODW24 TaxID=2185142 RepID=UPI000DF72416|nr:8-amino-7-oxononanoate synthase [Altererythrobacter sp. ZODW24]